MTDATTRTVQWRGGASVRRAKDMDVVHQCIDAPRPLENSHLFPFAGSGRQRFGGELGRCMCLLNLMIWLVSECSGSEENRVRQHSKNSHRELLACSVGSGGWNW